jgi:hypothetical protein
MMTHCPLTGCNIKHLIISLIAGFAFTFVYDYVVHTKLMMDMYAQTPQLWRTEEAMADNFHFMLLSQIATVFLTVVIFSKNYEGKGLAEGLRYGLLIGLLMGVLMASSYIWMPISGALALSWLASGVGLGLGLGAIYSFTYRK